MAHELHWIPAAVRNLAHSNGIRTRQDLANFTTLGQTTVYKAFDQNFAGKATSTVIAAMCEAFNVPIGSIVAEPIAQRRHPSQTRKFSRTSPANPFAAK